MGFSVSKQDIVAIRVLSSTCNMIRTDKAHIVYTDHLTYTTNLRHDRHASYLHHEDARGVTGVLPYAGLART